MLDICLLGSGGMMPLPKRKLTSLMGRFNGSHFLIDCGEGTQVAIREVGWSFKQIDVIYLTHFHGDHIGGLPGLLLTMGNSDRTEPLKIVGPKGVERVVNQLRVIAPELPFEIEYYDIEGAEAIFDWFGYQMKAFKVNHRVTCYGYRLDIKRLGKFDIDRAKALNIPVQMWGRLQKGEILEFEGKEYTPQMVLGEERKGISLVYSTDTRPTESIEENSKEVDLLILEGMYGDESKLTNAKEHKHMMMQEAAQIANKALAKKLWLTHYSPAMVYPRDYIEELRDIFKETYLGKDGLETVLTFEED